MTMARSTLSLLTMAFAAASFATPTQATAGKATPAPAAPAQPAAHEKHERHWGYADGALSVGPEHWSSIEGAQACATGAQQTPIDLKTSDAAARDLPDLVIRYAPTPLVMVNNGHTVQVTYAPGSTLGRAGGTVDLKLAQFHFHTPSEHTLDGKSFPAELHLVHLDAAGKPAAVIGVFLAEGASNEALAAAFKSLPAKPDDRSEPKGATIDATALLPADRTFLTYPGSLTTPPCSEGITWFVMKSPIQASSEQLRALAGVLGRSNRPLQKLGARHIELDSTPGH